MKKIAAEQLMADILSSDIGLSKSTMRLCNEKYKYKMPEILAKAVFTTVRDYRKQLDNTELFDTIVKLVNIAIWSNTASLHIDFLQALIFDGLLHKSGKVRQNAKAMSQNYIRFLGNGEESEAYLYKIEKFIKDNEPKKIPMYVDRMAPSVYKSLVYAWHETIMCNKLWEKLTYTERMLTLNIPCYSWQYDDTTDDEPPELYHTRDDWRNYFDDFIVTPPSVSTLKSLKNRELMAIKQLRYALGTSGVSIKYEPKIVQTAASSVPENLRNTLLEIIFDIRDRHQGESQGQIIVRSDAIARAVQTVDNNTVMYTVSGAPFTRLLTPAIVQEEYKSKPLILDVDPLILEFHKTHESIDDILLKVITPATNDFRQFCDNHNITDYVFDDTEVPRQVAHYIVDWLIQIDYRLFLTKSPKRLAAAAWSIVGQRNPNLTIFGLENSLLADYAERPSSSGHCQLFSRLNALLEREMADPRILESILEPDSDWTGYTHTLPSRSF
jgi:hypothetical protein